MTFLFLCKEIVARTWGMRYNNKRFCMKKGVRKENERFLVTLLDVNAKSLAWCNRYN